MSFRIDDAGRSQSSRPKQKRDCTVRALAIAAGLPYDDAYEILRDAGRKCSTGFDIEAWARKNTIPGKLGPVLYCTLDKMPYTKDHREVGQARRYRLQDFVKDKPDGCFIVSCAKHVFAVVHGEVRDDLPWYYHENRPVYGWIELRWVLLPLWQVTAVRPPLKSGRRFVRSVAIVEGVSYKSALRVASKFYEWSLRKGEDLHVEPFSGGANTANVKG